MFQNCLKFHSPNGSWNYVQQFRNITRGIYAKYHYKSCYYLYKLDGSVRSNQKSFENTGPPFEVDHFSRSHRSEFWLNGSHPWTLEIWADPPYWRSLQFDSFWIRGYKLHIRFIGPVVSQMPVRQITKPPIFKKNITLNFGKGCKETVVISFIPLQWAWEQGFFLIQTNIVWFVTNRKNSS